MAENQIDPLSLLDALELLDEGVSILDADYNLVYCNRRVEDLLDLPPHMLATGQPLETIFRYNAERGEYGPGDPEEIVASRMALLGRHEAHRFERTRLDGTIIEVKGKPLENGGFITIYTDISELKQTQDHLREAKQSLEEKVRTRTAELHQRETDLAHQKALLEATLENISQGISVFDGDLRLALYNDHFLKMLDFPESFGEIGKPLRDFFTFNAKRGEYGDGDIEALVEERMELARHPQPHTFTRTLSDGTIIEVCGNPMPRISGGFVTTYADVTARIRAQDEAIAAKEEAEQALARLKEAQASLIQAEKMAALGQLVAGVAHEINTPLGVSITAITHFQKRLATLSEALEAGKLRRSEMNAFIETAQEATHLAMTNLQRAAELVDGFRNIAVDQTTEKRRVFNVRNYSRDVILSLQSKIKDRGIAIKVACPEDLKLDSYPGAYSQVLSNLLLNATEHAFQDEEQKTISLDVTTAGDQLTIAVRDNGRGIPEEDLPKIFDPFFTTGRGQGRSGLGLNRVYNIVRSRLHGNITCESTLNEGTCFSMTLPLTAPESRGPDAG